MKARSAAIRGILTSRISLSLHPGYMFFDSYLPDRTLGNTEWNTAPYSYLR
jgi:hypothetical protein